MTSKIITSAGTTVTDEIIESAAEEAQSHPRTIERRLLGLPIKGRALARRVDEVLARRGLAVALPSAPPRSAA